MKLKTTTFCLLAFLYSVKGHSVFCFDVHQDNCSNAMCTSISVFITSKNLPDGNFSFQLCSQEFYLQSNLSISDKSDVVIRGMPSKIHCNKDIGIHIFRISGLVLEDIELVSCGTQFSAPGNDRMHLFMSSLYIVNCTDITITKLSITNSSGNGMTMIDNRGNILVQNSTFSMNKDIYSPNDFSTTEVGSGLRIILSYCHPRHLRGEYQCSSQLGGDNIISSKYSILHCTFTENNDGRLFHKDWSGITNDQIFPEESEYLAEGFGRGGGLCIVIDKESRDNLIQIEHCNFVNNSAVWGGGLYVAIQEMSSNNIVEINSCTFYRNHCDRLAGGGSIIGYQANSDNHPQNNSITFESCSFVKNSAGFGGGVSFYSSPSSKLSNNVHFKDCNWTENFAIIGAAVNVAPQVWISFIYDLNIEITFTDCTFMSNYLESDVLEMDRDKSYRRGKGTFSAVGYHIILEGTIEFDRNTGSAMYLTSTEIEFRSNSSITFSHNHAFEGGAVYMQGFAALILNDDVILTFINNTAERAGGAIFQYTYDNRDFFASQSCFIRYNGREYNVTKRNISLFFDNNTAGCGRECSDLGHYGHSVYATTLTPCFNSRDCNIKANYCIAEFHFQNYSDYDLSTSGKNITWDKNVASESIIWAVPGRIIKLPIKTNNDLGREVFTVYHVTVQKEGNQSLSIQNDYTYLFNKSIVLWGAPNESANLVLKTIDARGIEYTLKVIIQECPPGFVHNSQKMRCECSTRHMEKRFPGIQTCDDESFEAKLISGYWMSYDKKVSNDRDVFGVEQDLLYATCPRGQCFNEIDNHEQVERLLPSNTSVRSLDEAVCVRSRTGILCSECKKGFAAHYHDDTFACKHDNCKWGWLLYIVSELIPVTVFFILIILLDIKLTNGAINGTILYFQLSDTMLLRGNGFILFPQYSEIILNVYLFITRIFNLNFFAVNRLSFCMWKNASTLDLLAFKYLTILFSSALVVIIIAIFKYNKTTKFFMKLKASSIHSTKNTIIHGISGFLVICYSECTRLSLLLLYIGNLYSSGNNIKRRVSFYNGELEYFRGKHLLYALPAIFIFIFFGILPPLLFLSYPLCYKVLAILKLSESKLSRFLCVIIPLEKFKPFFDSFQSSYKDEYRFFSGLYFLYRFTTIITFSFQGRLTLYYTLVQVQLALILAVHAVCQPYKKRSHNIIDTLLFLNLSVINIITFFNYHLSLYSTQYQANINKSSVIQMVLLYLPLLYVLCLAGKKMVLLFKDKNMTCRCINKESRSGDSSDDYHKLSRSFTLSAAENRLRDM